MNRNRALVIVDMLNDFIRKDGSLYVKGSETIIENIVTLKKHAQKKNWPVLYFNDSHESNDIEFETWPAHCITGTRGAMVIDEVKPHASDDYIFLKQKLSGFSNPDVVTILEKLEIDELIVAGVATEYCVANSVIAAVTFGFAVTVVVDAIKGVELTPGDCNKALLDMGECGATGMSTQQILLQFCIPFWN